MIIFLERTVVALLILVLITQVILPTLFNWPLFVSFRRKTTLDEKLAAARAQKAEAEKMVELMKLENDIGDMKKRATHEPPPVELPCSGCGVPSAKRTGSCPQCGEPWIKETAAEPPRQPLITPPPPDAAETNTTDTKDKGQS